MPDNAIFAQFAYGAIIALFVGYAISLRVRRVTLNRHPAPQERK